jgi:hypothetical protein
MIDTKEGAIMVQRRTRSAGLFLLAQIIIIAGLAYGLSQSRSACKRSYGSSSSR